MDRPIRRSNLRVRKSLMGQIVCASCNRNFFPSTLFSENFDDSKQQICCDCEYKQSIEPPAKRTATQKKRNQISTAIKIEADNSHDVREQMGQLRQRNDQSHHANLETGTMVKIHFGDLMENHAVIPNNQAPVIVKQENARITSVEVIKGGNKQRVLKNKTNTIQTQGGDLDIMNGSSTANGVTNVVDENDTTDTLRQKFPNVSAFEMEFLRFLQSRS